MDAYPTRNTAISEHAHGGLYDAQGARAHGFRAHLHVYEYGPSGYPRAHADEHVHENGRGRVSGYARANEQDPHACVHEYGHGNGDVNDNVHVDEFLPWVITSFQGRKSPNSFSLPSLRIMEWIWKIQWGEDHIPSRKML